MKYQSVLELFSRAVASGPSRTAIHASDRIISYAELEAQAAALAETLISAGVPKGGIVAVLVQNRSVVVISLLGIMKAGCVFVPLETNSPPQRIKTMIAEAAPACILIAPELSETIARAAADSAPEAHVIFIGPKGVLSETARPFATKQAKAGVSESRGREYGPEDMCYIFFTSGSTGKPKGIAGTRQGIDHFIHWEIEALKLGAGVRVSQFPQPTFDAFLRDVFLPLSLGGTICTPPAEAAALLDTRKLIQWIDALQINLIHCVPSLFRSLINAGPQGNHFSTLQYVLMAGEPLLPADVRRWFEIFGDRIQLINLYGQTETTMAKFFYFIQPADQDRRFIPIGKPMEGARAMVIDELGNPCTPGEIGEIYVRTPYRSLGYYRQPQLTDEVFIPNPFDSDPSDIVYKTGDLGRPLEDGTFEFLGRKDSQLKIRGVRVEPGEVENLLRSHAAVADAAVVDRDDAYGNKYLCAYVVPRPGADVWPLKDFLRSRVPEYLVPSAIVTLEALPLTLHGKVDRNALPVPDHDLLELKRDFIAPSTPAEGMLADIWADLLGLKQVGVHDDFFDLGGHSLLIPQLISRINKAFEVELSLIAFFEKTTISELAQSVEMIGGRGQQRHVAG
jgi:amino acid adenylation domain-containing protein